MFPSGGEKPFGFLFLCPSKDELCGPDPSLSEELTSILNELTQLSKSEHCKVALRARQVGSWGASFPPRTSLTPHGPSAAIPRPDPRAWPLAYPALCPLPLQILIASHLPSYELRHNQVESIFLSAIDMYGHQFCPENLKVRPLPPIHLPQSSHCGPSQASGRWAPRALRVRAPAFRARLQVPVVPSNVARAARRDLGEPERGSVLQDGQRVSGSKAPPPPPEVQLYFI